MQPSSGSICIISGPQQPFQQEARCSNLFEDDLSPKAEPSSTVRDRNAGSPFNPAVPFGQENGRSRLQRAQEDVEEVKGIMLDNLNKASERSGKLEDLEDRADQLLAKVRLRSGHRRLHQAALWTGCCGGAAQEHKCRIYILIVSDGTIFREAFPLLR